MGIHTLARNPSTIYNFRHGYALPFHKFCIPFSPFPFFLPFLSSLSCMTVLSYDRERTDRQQRGLSNVMDNAFQDAASPICSIGDMIGLISV